MLAKIQGRAEKTQGRAPFDFALIYALRGTVFLMPCRHSEKLGACGWPFLYALTWPAYPRVVCGIYDILPCVELFRNSEDLNTHAAGAVTTGKRPLNWSVNSGEL